MHVACLRLSSPVLVANQSTDDGVLWQSLVKMMQRGNDFRVTYVTERLVFSYIFGATHWISDVLKDTAVHVVVGNINKDTAVHNGG